MVGASRVQVYEDLMCMCIYTFPFHTFSPCVQSDKSVLYNRDKDTLPQSSGLDLVNAETKGAVSMVWG